MIDRSLSGVAVVVFLLAVLGCESEGPSLESVERVDVPAVVESGQPHLSSGNDGSVWMSWVESLDGDRHALRYATLTDTSWTRPQTAARGDDWFVNWADVPSLQPLPSGRLAAHFLKSNGPSALAYGVRIRQTTAEGEWQTPVAPHEDGTETEHGFVSLVPWSGDRLLAVWLDGRKMAGSNGHQGEMTLRGAVLDSSGAVEQRALLDRRTCECCPTSAVRTGDEALIAYRDRAEDETRNIRLVRFDGSTWSDPTLLHDDGWQIEGCPVNGPALAAQGKQVAAAWYTAPGGTPRVNVAFSEDGGRQFGDPVVVAEGNLQGWVDVVLLGDGTAVVTWVGDDQTGAALRARAVQTGTPAMPFTIASLSSGSRSVGQPALIRNEDTLYAAWTTPETGVQLARVPVQ